MRMAPGWQIASLAVTIIAPCPIWIERRGGKYFVLNQCDALSEVPREDTFFVIEDIPTGELKLTFRPVDIANGLLKFLETPMADQAENETRFGEIAVSMNMVPQTKLDRALVIQKMIFSRTKVHMSIGKVLKEMGIITQAQIDTVLETQR